MRLGEISLARGVEQLLDSVEVEEEGVTAAARDERVVSATDHVGSSPAKETAAADTIFVPTASGAAGLIAGRHEHARGLLAIDAGSQKT